MRLYGLTGGIASGKSTVSAFFREAGIPVIDADALAREVVEPGQPALAEISARFPGTLTAEGTLDRAKLGALIFQDPAERAALGAITHPRIQALALERTTALAATGATAAIYDAPLLIENKLSEAMNGVILVTCPPEVQLARLMARNALTEAQARQRIDSQMSLEQKRPFATWLIDNGGSLEATRAQVKKVIAGWKE
ncbi:MAG: dephospho-CoA kinase [Archangium sp.]|nr:dephospho-CoA kinase [Archangium sp.]MDP3155314.1 dephospho-CoA kinase [Archangium sp.]MDP3574768.1 dephospho-CoA kinase [Archangium sp.]